MLSNRVAILEALLHLAVLREPRVEFVLRHKCPLTASPKKKVLIHVFQCIAFPQSRP